MLQTLRDKTSGWIATVILGLLTIPFAFVGIEQYMVQRSDANVATLEAPPTWWQDAPSWWPVSVFWRQEAITAQEFQNEFERERQARRAEQGDAFDSAAFQSLETKREVLEQLIDRKVQAMAADTYGIVIGDALVRDTIQQIPAFQVDGKFNLERYQLALASQVPAQSPAQFDATVREGLRQSLVPQAIAGSNFVTQGELERLVRLMGERRDVNLLVLPAPEPATDEPVTDAQVQAWYDAHKDEYRAPETVAIEYVEVDQATMQAPPPPDEAELRARYEQEKSRYVEAEQRLASHILIEVPAGADEAAVQAAKAEAEQVAQQARAGDVEFAALAGEHSDDTGSAAAGGDLGWVGKGMMAGPFEDALFALEAGQVSDPVRTDFGWHVIKLREIKAGAQESFEQVRDVLAREQAEADRERAFNDRLGLLVDEVYKNPSSLAPAARELGLEVKQAGPFSRGSGEGIAANPEVQRVAFSEAMIEDGMASDPIEVAPGRSVLVRVTAHTPEQARPLPEVREQVVAAIRADRAQKAAMARAEQLLAAVRDGQSLQRIAEVEQLPAPQAIPGLPRGAPVPSEAGNEAIFAVPAPAEGGFSAGKVALEDGRIVLFTVDKVTPGDIADVPPDQLAQLREQMAMAAGIDNVRALVSAWRQRMDVTVNEKNL